MSYWIRRPVAVVIGVAIGVMMTSESARGQSVREAPSTVLALQPGDTVRVWAQLPTLDGRVGIVTAIDRDNLALNDARGRGAQYGHVIGILSLARVDVQRGRYRSGRAGAVGAALGMAGGALAGGLAGIAVGCRSACDPEDSGALATLRAGAIIGSLTGGVIGGLRGFRARPRWHRLMP